MKSCGVVIRNHLNESSSPSTINIAQFVTSFHNVTFVPVDEILPCDHSITGTSSAEVMYYM